MKFTIIATIISMAAFAVAAPIAAGKLFKSTFGSNAAEN